MLFKEFSSHVVGETQNTAMLEWTLWQGPVPGLTTWLVLCRKTTPELNCQVSLVLEKIF